MRELIVSEFLTLDGVMEAPGGEPTHPHTGWVFDFMSKEQEQYKLEEVREAEALLLGRVTYEGFSEAWPPRSGEFADKMNRMPKFVASTTLREPEWENTTVLGGDVPAEVAKLKQADGGPILVGGSCTLVQSLMPHGLIDEYRLMIFPVVLGSGKRLFGETPEKTPLELADTRTFGSGVVVQAYRAAAS
jgi:dihydrofolate reductase